MLASAMASTEMNGDGVCVGRCRGLLCWPQSWVFSLLLGSKNFLSPRRSDVALLATHFLQFCVPPLRRLVAAGRLCAPSERWILGTHCRRTQLPTIAEHHAAGQRACARVLLWTGEAQHSHSHVQKALQEPLFLPPRHEQAPRRRDHGRLSIMSPEHPKAGIAGGSDLPISRRPTCGSYTDDSRSRPRRRNVFRPRPTQV